MRHIFSHRASVKRNSRGKGEAPNMAATANTTTDAHGGGVGFTAGGSNSGHGGGSSGVSGHSLPSSPVPDWTGDPVALKDFASKRKVPGFARVVKGSYMTIGASKFSLQKQHHDIYIHSVKVGVKVLAHSVRRVEGGGSAHKRSGQGYARLHAMDQRLAVPLSYQGFFELLSEDGKSARPFSSVPDLAKAFPARCLVRENMKGYLSTGEGRLTFDKTKIITAGEQLRLLGEISLPAPSQGVKVKLLRCLDTKGDSVYLSFDQKGQFSPIAGENDFTGVLSIRDIVRRFRLPLTVKLVHGVRPKVPESKFSGLVRLDWVYTEETAFVCPVEKNHVRLLPVPCDVSLQLVSARNQEEMCSTETFKSMQAKCTRMVNNYNNTLHLLVSLPESLSKTQHRNSKASNIFSAPLHADREENPSRLRRSKSREDMLMDEIDDLYSYVRDGGVPPKTKFQYDSDEESYWEEPAYEPLDEFRARLKAIESGQTVSFPERYRPADPAQLTGLVGGGVTVPAPPPYAAGEGATAMEQSPCSGSGDGAKLQAGPVSDSPASDVSGDPPPLPPRRTSEVAATGSDTPAWSSTTASRAASFHVASSGSPQHHARPPVSARRASGHDPPPVVSPKPSPAKTDPAQHGASTSATEPQSAVTPTPSDVPPEVPPKRVSRSDSDPSTLIAPVPARTAPVQRQSSQADAKLGWKEKLRRFNSMQDKDREGNSSTSSDSVDGGRKVARRLARDFKDSDISSRTKASSGSSGGNRGVRKRMQTLYL